MKEDQTLSGAAMDVMRALFSWLAVCLALGLLCTPARADAGVERIDAIRGQMEAGQALYLAGKYAEAASVFEEAYERYPYSAFLFNAGVAYEKSGALALAVQRFRRYLEVDTDAPDAESVRQRVSLLDEKLTREQEGLGAAGSDSAADSVMKSLVLVETQPSGAPLSIFMRSDTHAAPYLQGAPNTGWTLVKRAESPVSLALAVGRYHVVVDKFQDFNISEADIDVFPGHVHHFKANLSQGAFMAFLRVTSNVEGAYIFLEKPKPETRPWGRAPFGELVPAGQQTVWVQAPGYEPQRRDLQLKHGEQQELSIGLKRVGFGFLRITGTAPKIEVFVDGISVGVWERKQVPLELRLAAGTHLLRVESEDRKPFEGFAQVPGGQILSVRAVMQRTYPRTAAWTQAILGAAFLGGATYLGLQSNRLDSDLRRDARLGILDAEDERIARGRWFAIGADAGFVLGGTLGILSVYNFVKDPLPESRVELSDPEEFEDPRAPKRETKPNAPPRSSKQDASTRRWFVASSPSSEGLTLSIGGHF